MRRLRRWNPRKSLQGQLILYFVLVSLLTILLTGVVANLLAQRALEQSIYARLETVAMVKEESLLRWKDERLADVVLLTRSPDVRNLTTFILDPAVNQSSTAYRQNYDDLDRLLQDVL